jgi:hypothetical protein
LQNRRTKIKGIGGHHRAYRGHNDEWLTPPEVIHALGEFDLDPCAPVIRPWSTAKQHYTIEDDGLLCPWQGRVFCNPPYGPQTIEWMAKLASHRNGIALTFARTETKMFFQHVWNRANALLFLKGRLYFYDVHGNKAKANAGAPSVLIAYGEYNVEALKNCGIDGKFVLL